jgi:hypothetical protein
MCPVVAVASGGAGSNFAEGSPAAPFDGSQVALAYPALPARLGAGAGRSTCRSFDQRGVFTRPKPVVWACRESSSPDLVVEDPRHVVNRRNVPGDRRRVRWCGFELCRGFTSAAVRRITGRAGVPGITCEAGSGYRSLHLSVVRPARRIHEAKTSRLGCRESSAPYLVVENPRHVDNRRNVPGDRRCVHGAGPGSPRVHQRRRSTDHRSRWRTRRYLRGWERVQVASTRQFSVIAALSRVCTDQIRRRRLSLRPNDWFWLREYAAQVERPTAAPIFRARRLAAAPVRSAHRAALSRSCYDPRRALTSSVSFGRTAFRSPTTPRSAKSKIGAFSSLLIATIVPLPFMPTLCWIAPEMPQAM